MNALWLTLLHILAVSSTLLSDTGCPCSVTRPPNASSTVALGCSSKIDWTGTVSPWCIVDRCATFYAGFGYADSCAQTGFTNLTVNKQTFYTGQNITLTWSSRNIAIDELVKITYQGATSPRTLTSGTNASLGYFSTPISDSATSLTTSAPVVISSVSPSVNLSSVPITILQSKIANVTVYDGSRLVGTGAAAAICDDRNLSIVWAGIGQAQLGVATLSIRSSGGGGGGGTTVGTALTIPVGGPTMNVSYLLPRAFTPSGFSTYSAQITIQGPGAPYTATSSQFNLNAAPSTTPSATPSITSSRLPSASNTPAGSLTGSPSVSSSQTPSPTPTPTPRTILDAASIVAESTKTTVTIIGAVAGSVVVLLIALGAYIYVQRKEAHERRIRRTQSTRQYIDSNSRETVYGVTKQEKGSYVMYQSRPRPSTRNVVTL